VDRLTRSSAFLHRLLESGVEIRFCDLPTIEGPTGRFMLQQMASVAELEAGMISVRTNAALAAAKAAASSSAARAAQSLMTMPAPPVGRSLLAVRASNRRNVATGHRSGTQRARHPDRGGQRSLVSGTSAAGAARLAA
jgi:DNA invertase Pin-like site-specific DNA recombinase